MKKIKYRVTNAFGCRNEDDILDAYLLLETEKGQGLVYHPRGKGECGSLEICMRVFDEWQSADDSCGYVNIDKQKQLDKLVKNLQSISYKDLKQEK